MDPFLYVIAADKSCKFRISLNIDSLNLKSNEELDELIKRKYIIRFIKSQRLKWFGHVERMPNEREVTRIYKWKPLASRPKGRPKNRLEDDVRMDLQKMKIKNWKRSVLDRDSWRTVVERTKTHKEL
jgi:hypothetical protein